MYSKVFMQDSHRIKNTLHDLNWDSKDVKLIYGSNRILKIQISETFALKSKKKRKSECISLFIGLIKIKLAWVRKLYWLYQIYRIKEILELLLLLGTGENFFIYESEKMFLSAKTCFCNLDYNCWIKP